MLAGDLTTMALADLLQWVDATRARALLWLETEQGMRAWLLTADRTVVAASPPPLTGRLAAEGGLRAATREALLDLFLWPRGRFELRDGAAAPSDAVEVSMPIPFLVMEGLRLLDEHARLEQVYPDNARLGATDAEPDEELDTVESAIRRVAMDAPSLGEARLVLGLSRPALLRRVEELRRRGLVEVEGTPHGPDTANDLLDRAQVLLRERQYAEAAHVFRTMLAGDPTNARARLLLAEAERLEIEAAYRTFSPTDIVARAPTAKSIRVTGPEQAILECLARARSVAVLVLVSPLREVETLKAVERLAAKGLVTVEPAD